MLGVDKYVDANVRVSRDAYVVVVASDLDGRFRVVFPDSPDESGFVSAAAPRRLSKFFAGFGTFGSARYGRSAFSVQPVSRFTPRGVMVAIASDRPLQFERLTNRNGDWDEVKLEQLAYGRGVTAIGYVLGSQLALAGQDFDADYSGFTKFASPARYSLASLGAVGLCESDATNALYYDPPPATRYFERNGVLYAVITTGDACRGYETHTIPVVPDAVPKWPAPEDTTSSAAAAARVASRPVPAESRPTMAGGLRFRPPEQLPFERRVRDGGASVAPAPEDERVRRRLEEQARNAMRPSPGSEAGARPRPVHQEPAQQEPMRMHPPAVREAPPAAPAGDAPSGKPRKE
jgi:hypothetical protein